MNKALFLIVISAFGITNASPYFFRRLFSELNKIEHESNVASAYNKKLIEERQNSIQMQLNAFHTAGTQSLEKSIEENSKAEKTERQRGMTEVVLEQSLKQLPELVQDLFTHVKKIKCLNELQAVENLLNEEIIKEGIKIRPIHFLRTITSTIKRGPYKSKYICKSGKWFRRKEEINKMED